MAVRPGPCACVLMLGWLAGCATSPDVRAPGPTSPPPAPAQAAPPRAAAETWLGGADAHAAQRRQALAAGVPALATEATGYYVDVAEARLREQLAGTGADVARVGDDLRVRLPGAAMFPADRADLDGSARTLLDAVGTILQKFDKTVVEVAGYTDASGAADHNQALSERRAASVAAYLQGRGVVRARLSTVGGGEGHAIASNATSDGRARNRRIELTISPLVK